MITQFKLRIPRSLFGLLAVMAFQIMCSAEMTKLPPEVQKALSDTSRFHQIHSVTNLPTSVFSICDDVRGKLAEPGQKWQEGCMVADDSPPSRRMIWALTDGDYYVVHYEEGGRAHTFHVLVCRMNAGVSKPDFIWKGSGGKFQYFNGFIEEKTNMNFDVSCQTAKPRKQTVELGFQVKMADQKRTDILHSWERIASKHSLPSRGKSAAKGWPIDTVAFGSDNRAINDVCLKVGFDNQTQLIWIAATYNGTNDEYFAGICSDIRQTLSTDFSDRVVSTNLLPSETR